MDVVGYRQIHGPLGHGTAFHLRHMMQQYFHHELACRTAPIRRVSESRHLTYDKTYGLLLERIIIEAVACFTLSSNDSRLH